MASRYEVLAQLIDSQNWLNPDESGNHDVIVGVLRLLHESDESKLADDIYEMIANCFTASPFGGDTDG